MKKALVVVSGLVAILLLVGITQDYFNSATRSCKKFDASQTYTGYQCKAGIVYEQK